MGTDFRKLVSAKEPRFYVVFMRHEGIPEDQYLVSIFGDDLYRMSLFEGMSTTDPEVGHFLNSLDNKELIFGKLPGRNKPFYGMFFCVPDLSNLESLCRQTGRGELIDAGYAGLPEEGEMNPFSYSVHDLARRIKEFEEGGRQAIDVELHDFLKQLPEVQDWRKKSWEGIPIPEKEEVDWDTELKRLLGK